ncbi:MAG: hypothetical protein IPO26_21370 [Saprospiraceae bacterium]|nr:hypothetical protein [Saprospiraceae bacterium]
MRILYVLMFFLMMSVTIQAQFINNGATVTIQSGATLRVETSFINNSGTVTNNGTLEVKDNFTNAATFTSATASTVKFIGTTPSVVTSGGAAFHHVSMEKTAENITLADAMSVAGTLTFTNDNNKVILGANNLTIQDGGSIASADDNEYVVANDAGSLIKGLSANGTITHEIGDASNYTPLSSAVTGSAYASATLGARVYTGSLQAKYTDATDYINREWQVVASGITDYTNIMTGTYVAGDATGTQSLIKGSTYHTADWHFDGSNNAALQVIASTTTSDVKLTGQNFFGRANLKAYLSGALPPGTTLTTTLRRHNLIPRLTPYTAAPFNAPSVTATSIPATATDWILVEVRDASNAATIISQTSAFILNDGNIVNIDGSALKLKNAVPNGHIALRHRNHLAIRTANPMDLVNPPMLKDFSAGTSEAYTNPSYPNAPYLNANMKQIGSYFAMWGGNANNQNEQIDYNGGSNDKTKILQKVGLTTPNNIVTGYHIEDVNLSGSVEYNGGGNDKTYILQQVGLTTPNKIILTHF